MNFDQWWNEVGSALRPEPNEDQEEHSKRVCMAAFGAGNGKLFAYYWKSIDPRMADRGNLNCVSSNTGPCDGWKVTPLYVQNDEKYE